MPQVLYLVSNNDFGWQIGFLGALTIVIMVHPRFQGRKFRVFRTLTFVALGASGFAPLIHGVTIFSWSQMVKQSGLPYYLVEGGFLLTGSFLYAVRFPEVAMMPTGPDYYVSVDQVSRESISGPIRRMGHLPSTISHHGGARHCVSIGWDIGGL